MKKALLSVVAALLSLHVFASEPALDMSGADKLGWKLAVHAYTFRKFPLFEAIDKTAELGLKYMSLSGAVSFDGKNFITTVDLSDADLKRILDHVKAKGLTLVNIGVVQLPNDEAKCRHVFDFAKKAGVDTLVSEPPDDALDLVEKLCKEYNIKVGIHDHPRPNHYWNPDVVLAAVKNRTHLMGACADTGHWLRSGLTPVDCLKKLDGRVIALHFKDLVPNEEPDKRPAKKRAESKALHDVPWGTGTGNMRAQLEELKRQGFKGAFCVEYEYHWDNSQPEIAECVKWFYKTANELAK